jgi:hypothetical protein
MKTSKKFRIIAAVLIGGIVVASSACSGESPEQVTAPQQISVAPAPNMSNDGTYDVALDPSVATTLVMGDSKLEIPAGAICDLATSGYGPEFWDQPCAPEQNPVKLTVTLNSTLGDGATVDFSPELRFSPSSEVVLRLSAPSVSKQDAKDWVILYCPSATSTTSGNGAGGAGGGKDGNKCVNEALKDQDLRTDIDYDLKQLFRRIKHFSRYAARSGYMIAE